MNDPSQQPAEQPAQQSPAAVTSLAVHYLFTMELSLGRTALMPGGPHGTRAYAPVENGTVSGPQINATVMPGADWVTVRPDGFVNIDVRLALQTDDGCVVLMEYRGILDVGPDRRPRTAIQFQAGDDRYSWLNHVVGIGIGTPGKQSVTYEVYALQ